MPWRRVGKKIFFKIIHKPQYYFWVLEYAFADYLGEKKGN